MGHLGGEGLWPPPHQMERFHRVIRPLPLPCTSCRGGAFAAPVGYGGQLMDTQGKEASNLSLSGCERATKPISLYLYLF